MRRSHKCLCHFSDPVLSGSPAFTSRILHVDAGTRRWTAVESFFGVTSLQLSRGQYRLAAHFLCNVHVALVAGSDAIVAHIYARKPEAIFDVTSNRGITVRLYARGSGDIASLEIQSAEVEWVERAKLANHYQIQAIGGTPARRKACIVAHVGS